MINVYYKLKLWDVLKLWTASKELDPQALGMTYRLIGAENYLFKIQTISRI